MLVSAAIAVHLYPTNLCALRLVRASCATEVASVWAQLRISAHSLARQARGPVKVAHADWGDQWRSLILIVASKPEDRHGDR